MGLRLLQIFSYIQCQDRLESSESDIYRRQIMATKVAPRAVRVWCKYSRFKSVSSANQITVIGNQMSVQTSRFANVWSLFRPKQI